MKRLWQLTLRYWFDAGIVAALGIGLAITVLHEGGKKGPEGPLWFDILAVIAFTTPLLARRRFPFKAPLAVFVVKANTARMSNQSGPSGPFLPPSCMTAEVSPMPSPITIAASNQ